jgi:hypothetical protein
VDAGRRDGAVCEWRDYFGVLGVNMCDVTNSSVGRGPVFTEAELLAIPAIQEMWREECRRRAARRAFWLAVAFWAPVLGMAAFAVYAFSVWG